MVFTARRVVTFKCYGNLRQGIVVDAIIEEITQGGKPLHLQIRLRFFQINLIFIIKVLPHK